MADPQSFKLIIEDDEGRRNVVPVELGEVSVGRLDGNTIRLNERNVSRRHARIVRDNGAIYAEDLESYNGVWINGDRIKGRQQIREGDLIRIGDFQIELRGEGLARRTEETTQRTLLADVEATQPEIRMTTDGPDPGTARAEPTAIIRMSHLEDVEQARKQGKAISAGQRSKLVCVSTQYAGREFEITKTEMVLGRTNDNDIAIDHRSVSRHHAKIVTSGRSARIVDMKSANGTFVNGEEYAQIELKRGDLIELGHVKLRFLPPGENYTFTPEEVSVLAGQGKAGADSTGEAEVDTPAATRAPTLSGVLKNNPALALAIAGLLVVIIILVVWVAASGNGEHAASGQGLPTSADGSLRVGPNDGDVLMARANTAFQQRRWQQAATLAKDALAADPAREPAARLAERAEAEAAAQAAYDTAVSAIHSSAWSDAWNKLQEIPESSTYHAQARSLTDQVRAALVTERISHADRLLADEAWDDAEAVADEIAGLDAARPEISRIRAAVEEGRRRTGARGAKGKPPRVKVVAAPTKTKPPGPAPAAVPAPVEDVKVLFADGAKAMSGGQFDKAIDLFNRCIKADKRYCKCQRALGIAYARAGNGPKAYRYYKEYLKCEPNAADRDQVEDLLRQYEQAQ